MAENQNIEYKESWRDEYLKWICGFANAQGGKIFIGYDDKGKVVGVANAKRLMEDIPNKIRDGLGIVVAVNQYEQNGLPYIEIDVPPYSVGITYKGVYHYRSGSTKQVLNGPALEAFLLRKRGATWDNLPLPIYSIDDVDDGAIARFKKLAAEKGRIEPQLLDEPKETLLEKLRLTRGKYLTNAAMLLFSKDPEEYQLGAFIKVGFFESDAEILYQDEIRGSLLDQIDKAIELIYFKYMKAKIRYEGIQRIERYFVPEDALREALLNAICHKHYQSGIPIQVSVYEDRLYVANVGSLPDDWSSEDLMNKHSSKPYNPNIAHVFYLAGLIESWGRGVEKICDALKKEKQPKPEYTVHSGDIMIKFTGREDSVVRTSAKTSDKASEKSYERLSDNERRILELLIKNPEYTIRQMKEILSSGRTLVTTCLKSLKEKGLIERIGSDRKGSWKVNR
ncbi:MAG: putative DNA binding domain-containing protein [Thermoguttaceae bacterium]|nr:putative DNA binding domain-containing protein [Thermoguttaceae bacterium]